MHQQFKIMTAGFVLLVTGIALSAIPFAYTHAQEPKPATPAKPAAQTPALPQVTPKSTDDDPVAITRRVEDPKPLTDSNVIGEGQYGNFRYPVINGKGQVAFISIYPNKANSTGYSQAIFLREPDGKWGTVREGDKILNLKDDITAINNVTMNECGDVIFSATLAGKAGLPQNSSQVDMTQWITKASGLFVKNSEGIKTILRLGEEVPNMPSFFSNVANPFHNCKGMIAFIGTYTDPDGRGLFVTENGSLKLVARSGQSIGAGETRVFSEHFYPGRLNEKGEIAWFSRIGSDSGGIFVYRQGKIEALALQGKPAPVPYKTKDGKTQFANFIGFGNRAPSINDNGDVVFAAFYDGPEAGRALFYKPVNGPMQLVGKSGDRIVGTGSNFTDFNYPVINNRGQIVFLGIYGARNRGLFIKNPKGIEPVVMQDEKAQGAGPNEQLNNFTPPSLNDRGEVVFWGQFKDASTAIFLKDAKGLHTIAKRGEKLPEFK